jgi:murein DD-endopeptidase MepM/ murein hydrolase activator NlpD
MMNHVPKYLIIAAILLLCSSCNEKISSSLFKKLSPHEAYEQKLKDAGLSSSTMYQKWVNAADRSLKQPMKISIPYREKAYFASENPEAASFRFEAKNGERLHVKMSLQGLDSARFFIDLFEVPQDTSKAYEYLQSIKAGDTSLTYDIEENGNYLLRIQPELLVTFSYELALTAEPSLANPVAAAAKQHISSLFGDGRDAGQRKHEGIDIFAAPSTPAVAAANGTITHVGNNNLGGKVVFLKPEGRSINLYYAHLDSQLVAAGQQVSIGDTIGLIGNTGNAITTAPHLHFGIYTNNGAVDPLPFLQPNKSKPPKIISNANYIGDTVKIIARNKDIPIQTPLLIEAAVQNGYRVVLPDRSKTFLLQKNISHALHPLKTITINQSTAVYKEPNSQAAILTDLNAGTRLNVIGNYKNFYLIQKERTRGWIQQ